MRPTFKGLSLLFLLPLAGCDPGMTIRQAVQHDRVRVSPGTAGPEAATVNVKTSDPLIGETWYAPDATITNALDTPITISRVELIAKGISYANKPRGQGTYPLVVGAGRTETLDICFDLREDVWKTFFKQPAELRVYYGSDGKEQIAHTTVIGEHLGRNTP